MGTGTGRLGRLVRTLALATVVVAFGAGCSGDDGVSVPDGVAVPLASELGGVLGRLPTGPDGAIFVTALSLDGVDASVAADRSCRSVDGFRTWLGDAFGERRDLGAGTPEVLQGATIGRLEAEFGISLCDVDWIAESVRRQPPTSVFSADVDEARVSDAIRNDPVWGEGTFTIDSSTDTEFWDWGDEIDFQRTTPFRPRGIGGQLAVFDGEADGADVVALTEARADMVASITGGRSVAENPSVATALPILTAADPLAVVIVNDAPNWSRLAAAGEAAEAPSWALVPYTLLAAAQGIDGDGGFVEVVLVHRSALDAEANLGKLQSMFAEGTSVRTGDAWTERLTIESVGSRDSVLIARLRATDRLEASAYGIVYDSLVSGDSLFVTAGGGS